MYATSFKIKRAAFSPKYHTTDTGREEHMQEMEITFGACITMPCTYVDIFDSFKNEAVVWTWNQFPSYNAEVGPQA